MSRFTESFTASSLVARNGGLLHGMRWLLAPPRFRHDAASSRDKVESIGWPGSSEVAPIFAGDEVWLATVPAGRSPRDEISLVRPTVLIVDDHEAFRASARALLQAGGFDVIGEASDGTEAIAAVTALRPAIVLLDVQLPGLDGLAVAERLAQAADPPMVVLISGRAATAYGPRLGRTPARGFISKSELSRKALAALIG